MPPRSRDLRRGDLVVVAAVCGAFGLYGWAIFVTTFFRDGALGMHFNAPGVDFTVFYAAARAYFDGNLPLVFDGWQFTDHLNARFAGWLSGPLPYHPWLYPPHFLLLLLPFGLLPFGLAYALFIATTLAALIAVVWRFARPGYARRLQLAALLLSPAAAITATAGQNAFLTAALLVGGFRLLERYPALGGGVLGVLSFKPQFCLMVPVALIAARQWRALAGAGAVALALMLASAAVFGVTAWREWVVTVVAPPRDVYQAWVTWGRMGGQSVYTCARVLGASDAVANAAQAAAALLAAGGVLWAFRRPLAGDLRLVVLLAATLLAAPHVSGYDTVLLAIAAALLFCRAIDQRLSLPHFILIMSIWLLPPFSEPLTHPAMVLLPVLVVAVVAVEVFAASRQPSSDAYAD